MTNSHTEKYKKIYLVSGSGSGKTALAAFDSALASCGIGDYNLIRLSSVLPPFTEVVKSEKWQAPPADWGHRLYVVYAYGSAKNPGTKIWAGVGWVVLEDRTGAGLFVEHHADSKEECQKLINDTIDGLCLNRGLDPKKYTKNAVYAEATCSDEPVGALVAVVFHTEGWQ